MAEHTPGPLEAEAIKTFEKVAEWHEQEAQRSSHNATTVTAQSHSSYRDACLADARNHTRIAKDMRAAIAKVTGGAP